jgi:3-hydroxyisobutyrate dehydrogenase
VTRTSVLGMGRMGRAIAARLLATGHQVTIWNRSPTDTSSLISAGASVASSVPDAVRAGEVVMTALSDDAAVLAVALGDDGVCAALGMGSIYADCSTVSPATTRTLQARCAGFVAVPVLGGPAAVEAGTATYLAGGDPRLVDTLEPVLTSLSPNVRRFASSPLASSAKVASNLLLLTGVVGLAEAVTVARAGGLSDDEVRDLLGHSPLVPPALANRFEAVLAGSVDGWWTVGLGAKDAGLGVDIAASAGADVPLAALVRDVLTRAARSGLEDADIAAVARLYRSSATAP